MKNRLRKVLALLSVLTGFACLPGFAQDITGPMALATSAEPANPSPRPTSWGTPEGRLLFPHNWVRGYVDFSFAPPHNEPDLGRCSQSSAGNFGGGLAVNMDVTGIFETSNDNLFQASTSRFHFNTANQTLYYSPNGTTGSEVALAQLEAGVTLHPTDLHVVA